MPSIDEVYIQRLRELPIDKLELELWEAEQSQQPGADRAAVMLKCELARRIPRSDKEE